MKIVWDIDGVQGEFSRHFLQWFGFEDQSDPTDWHDKRFRENFHKIQDLKEFWMNLPPLLTYEDLKNHPNYIEPIAHMTARNVKKEVTSEWLKKVGAPVPDKVISVGVGGSKVKYLEQLDADILVDDAYHNYEEVNNAGIKCKCVLVTRPHNAKYSTKLRVFGLEDFYHRLPEIKEKLTYIAPHFAYV